jgi:hypothetical protein
MNGTDCKSLWIGEGWKRVLKARRGAFLGIRIFCCNFR